MLMVIVTVSLPISLPSRAVLRAQDQSREQAFQELRDRMVDEQIVGRGVSDERVLEAMRRVPRHEFVPSELAFQAYEDHPLSIGWGQTISQPFIVAFMTQAVDLQPASRVLEVGTGSGYQAAVLAQICDEVYTIEIIPELAERAAAVLKVLGYGNIRLTTGDGYEGWPEHAPYDAIIVTCSPTDVPPPLVDQLAEGGRMIIPIDENGNQSLVLMNKKDGRLTQRSILPVLFVPMIHKKGWVR